MPRVDYDDLAATYDRRYEDNEYPGIARALERFVGDRSNARVLEVGCGTGYWLALLARRGLRVAGIDPSNEMLTRARARVPTAELVRGRAEALPWPSRAFDRVFCVNALHHFSNRRAFMREARRVLRTDGLLISVGLDPHAQLDQWFVYDHFEPTLAQDRQRFPATAEIREALAQAGFERCASHEVEHLSFQVPARIALETGRLSRAFTSQLSVLSDSDYQRGVASIRRAIEEAEAAGEVYMLPVDLRLYATLGHAQRP